MTDYVETMRKILKENWIIVFQGEEDEVLDIDSLRFISVIVQIEEEFGVTIDNKYLGIEYKTLNDYVNLLKDLI